MNGLKLTKDDLQKPYVVAALGIDPEEVALALQIMDKDGDNVAHFGINRCFLFSEYVSSKEDLQ